MLISLLALLCVSPASAHPEHDAPTPRPAAPAPAAPATVIPATYPEVVNALRERIAAVEVAIDSFKIADVHAASTTATDLATAIPGKATAMTAANQAATAAAATHLKEQLAQLVAKADKGDMVSAKKALALVRTDIDTLEGLLKQP